MMIEVFDLRKITYMAEWPRAIDGLESVRADLEDYIAPYVSQKKSEFGKVFIFQFRGKRRYLKGDTPMVVITAAYQLSWLYRALAAIRSDDIDQAIRNLVGFAKGDMELWGFAFMGCSVTEAAAEYRHTKRERIKSRLGKRVLRDFPEPVLRAASDKHKKSAKRMKCITDDVNEYRRLNGVKDKDRKPVDRKTVLSELRERGIVE